MKRLFAFLPPGLITVTALLACSRAAHAPAAVGVEHSSRGHTAAEVRFMSGMIRHHAQALVMAGWAPTHEASPAVRVLSERIVVGQRDEITLMQRWLRDRRAPIPEVDSVHSRTPGMDHSMHMPGMLTAEQLAQLDDARGAEFDRLFLTFMIQHHQGALTMVRQLLEVPGAAEDDALFKFVSDLNADQTIEIERMHAMLKRGAPAGRSP